MDDAWQFQMRITLADEWASVMRNDPADPVLRPLVAILSRHNATLKSQYDAFTEYLAEAEQQGIGGYPLYSWTKATLDDPDKRRKHMRVFALRVDGQEVYSRAKADALEAGLAPLVDGVHITSMSKHDTNPANNLPIPPEHR